VKRLREQRAALRSALEDAMQVLQAADKDHPPSKW
jgi:hypothetical protein